MRCIRILALSAVAVSGAGCGGGSPAGPPGADPFPNCDPAIEHCGAIPLSVNACATTDYWPFVVASGSRPLVVHYSRLADASKAEEVLAVLEGAWTIQVDELGFAAPLDDGGRCGPDGRYDVFVWRGVDGAFVESIADNPLTAHDDYITYMAIDIGGPYGNALLDTTLAHEFNHAVQASDDWWESALFFELSATFVEALVYPEQDDYFFTLEDFQARPEWSLFYDDDYRTWYMYGAAIFLHFLHERHYPDDPGFIARIWRASRSTPPGNDPDYLTAMRQILLTERGVLLDDAVVEFLQWRWFTGSNDDGAHFSRGGEWPYEVESAAIDVTASESSTDLSAMVYGAVYLRLENGSGADVMRTIDLQQDASGISTWELYTTKGERVVANVTVPASSALVLIALVLPTRPQPAEALSFDEHGATLTLRAL